MRVAASLQEVWGRLSPNNLNSTHVYLEEGKKCILLYSISGLRVLLSRQILPQHFDPVKTSGKKTATFAVTRVGWSTYYREKSNLSCLKELGNGEEAGLPVVVGQLKDYREKSNLSCLEELGDGEETGLTVVVG